MNSLLGVSTTKSSSKTSAMTTMYEAQEIRLQLTKDYRWPETFCCELWRVRQSLTKSAGRNSRVKMRSVPFYLYLLMALHKYRTCSWSHFDQDDLVKHRLIKTLDFLKVSGRKKLILPRSPLDWSECYIMSTKKKVSYFYELNNTILQEVDTNPYLGLNISNALKWSQHIDSVCKKASSMLGFAKRKEEDCKSKVKEWNFTFRKSRIRI